MADGTLYDLTDADIEESEVNSICIHNGIIYALGTIHSNPVVCGYWRSADNGAYWA